MTRVWLESKSCDSSPHLCYIVTSGGDLGIQVECNNPVCYGSSERFSSVHNLLFTSSQVKQPWIRPEITTTKMWPTSWPELLRYVQYLHYKMSSNTHYTKTLVCRVLGITIEWVDWFFKADLDIFHWILEYCKIRKEDLSRNTTVENVIELWSSQFSKA